LMTERFGEVFENAKMNRKGPGSRFMNAWESVKRAFGVQEDDRIYEIGPLRLDDVEDSPYYDEEEAMVKLTWFVCP